jgi:hypothetical protein
VTLTGETIGSPAILARRHRVRSLSRRDLPQVAAMFLVVFRERSDAESAALSRDLETIFIEHPHYEESTSSLIYERHDGEIGGFLGSIPMRMDFMGRRRLGSVMSTWMVGDRSRDPRAGAMLMRSHLERRHAFTLVDTANRTSLEFAESLKISVLAAHSLQWIKPLNYCGYAMSSLRAASSSRALRALTHMARASENGFRRMKGERSRDGLEERTSRTIDADTFARHFLSLVQGYRLRPDWSADFVSWLLSQSSRRKGLGRLWLGEVSDHRGVIIGCYAYHVTSRGRAVVLQILARRYCEGDVLRALIAHARSGGCVVVCGSTNPRLLEGLLQIPDVFYRHTCSTGVKVRQPELLDSFSMGDALVGGLVGDSWMPLTSERYD